MIVPDVNVFLGAYVTEAPGHLRLKTWLEKALSGSETVGILPEVSLGFLRALTHPGVVLHPDPPAAVLAQVRTWFRQPVVRHLVPGPGYLATLERLLKVPELAGLTTELYLAAVALDYNATLCSTCPEMAAVPGLKWLNPLR